MGAVMMDNWGIEGAVQYLVDEKIEINDKVWINFLAAILLWDEIWYPDSPGFTGNWLEILKTDSRLASLQTLLYPIDKGLVRMSEDEILHDWYGIFNPRSDKEDTRLTRTPFYVILSNMLGINALLHPDRRDDSIMELLGRCFTRLHLFNRVDRELMEYYTRVNEELGMELYRFEYPVLFDYIRKNADNRMDELSAAIRLREDKDVIAFKEMIGDIETTVNKGNTQSLLTQLHLVSDAAKELTNRYNRKLSLGEITLSLKPSISKKISIDIPCNKNLKIHLAFINRLLDFGINERNS